MTDSNDHALLDLTDFGDRDAAINRASHGCPSSYTAIARRHMTKSENLTMGFMLFGSFVARTRGLHEAVVREIEANNPHAVFSLVRSWLEVITIAMYVIKKPTYAQYLMEGPGVSRPAKKSFEAMFHAVRDEAGQLREVYGQLSEFSHFGPLGVWNSHSIEDDLTQTVSWTDAPRWRDERHFQIACALAQELAVAGLFYLDLLGDRLLPTSDIDNTTDASVATEEEQRD